MSDLCYRERDGWIEVTDSIDHRELDFAKFWRKLAERRIDHAWDLLFPTFVIGTILPFSLPEDVAAVQVPNDVHGTIYRVWLRYPSVADRRQDWSPGRDS